MLEINQIAEICFVAIETLQKYTGQQCSYWDESKAGYIEGVKFHLDNPNVSIDTGHKLWLIEKLKDGWTWGEKIDYNNKTHPCICMYKDLPEIERAKDSLFRAIVHSLTRFVKQEELKSLKNRR